VTDREANDTSPPTDLELMLYADGELAGHRLAAVEAWLAASLPARTKLTSLRAATSLVRERALDSTQADGIADSVMSLIASQPGESAVSPKRVLVERRQAHDASRGRGVYLIAAGVLAAAAAVLLWVRPPVTTGGNLVAQHPRAAPETAATSAPAADMLEGDVEHGVEVAAVDFGTRMGAVFYVPSGTSASSTTTVVWLSDDSAGEDQ
jgi:hypothetical protein